MKAAFFSFKNSDEPLYYIFFDHLTEENRTPYIQISDITVTESKNHNKGSHYLEKNSTVIVHKKGDLKYEMLVTQCLEFLDKKLLSLLIMLKQL